MADKYDVEDPFIDDSEALMEQVAAASKDGFFVYSGPLIAEGERAKIDKLSRFFAKLMVGRSNRKREKRRQRNLQARKSREQRRGRRRRRVNRLILEPMKSLP